MTRWVLVSALLLAGCESEQYPECNYTDDPSATSGARRDACPSSEPFRSHDSRWTELRGVVRRGESVVSNAFVSIRPSAGSYITEAARRVVTDEAGLFGPVAYAPYRYDMTLRADPDVVVFRELTTGYFEPPLEGDAGPAARSWRARVDVETPPIAADHTFAVFASGPDVLGVEGDGASGYVVVTSTFDAKATLHVVEYLRGQGLATATRHGQADVSTSAAALRTVKVELAPIALFGETTFAVAAPAGFAPAANIDLIASFSRTSFAPLGVATPGQPIKLPVLPGAISLYRARATRSDGATSDSSEVSFDIFVKETKVSLPEPPVEELPLDNAAIGPAEVFSASGKGLLEHVLVPESGARASIRMFTTSSETTLPSFEEVNAPLPTGTWIWTVRSYPKLKSPGQMSGVLAYRINPFATSAPRTLTFR